jgi:DNA-binding CsgD family transcriptional regulator
MQAGDLLLHPGARREAPRRLADLGLFAIAVAATAALDRLNHGVVLIDKRCQVSFANRLAQSLCQGSDGLMLRSGQLLTATVAGSLRLRAAMNAAIRDGATSAVRLPRASGRAPLALQIAPLRAGREQPAIDGAMVFIHDADRSTVPSKEQLCEVYGFTVAEAGVAQLLLRGISSAKIAAALGISVETVRTHLRRALAKAGVHRQSDLILLLLRESGAGLYDEQPRPGADLAPERSRARSE